MEEARSSTAVIHRFTESIVLGLCFQVVKYVFALPLGTLEKAFIYDLELYSVTQLKARTARSIRGTKSPNTQLEVLDIAPRTTSGALVSHFPIDRPPSLHEESVSMTATDRVRWSDEASLPQEDKDREDGRVKVGVHKLQDKGTASLEAMPLFRFKVRLFYFTGFNAIARRSVAFQVPAACLGRAHCMIVDISDRDMPSLSIQGPTIRDHKLIGDPNPVQNAEYIKR